MKNKKAEEVIKRLEGENKQVTVRILGDRENKVYGFAILMESGQDNFGSTEKGTYHGINKKTIELLKEAEIKFKILS